MFLVNGVWVQNATSERRLSFLDTEFGFQPEEEEDNDAFAMRGDSFYEDFEIAMKVGHFRRRNKQITEITWFTISHCQLQVQMITYLFMSYHSFITEIIFPSLWIILRHASS